MPEQTEPAPPAQALTRSLGQRTPQADPGGSVRQSHSSVDATVFSDLGPDDPRYRILIVTAHAPTIYHAGGLRILDMVRLIKSRVPTAHIEVFTPANNALYGSSDAITRLSDKVTIAENSDFSLQEYTRRQSCGPKVFDVVDFQFPQPIEIVNKFRDIGKKIIFTPMESHIRSELISSPSGSATKLTQAEAILEQEIALAVDQTVCVSELDRLAISRFVDAGVVAVETGVSEIEFSGDIAAVNLARNSVCFVAYFGSRTNRDALEWYLESVHALIVAQVPDYEFVIVGRGDVSDILWREIENVNYVGEVDRIGPYIKGAAIGIAPALSGTGFRGKINQYAYLGIPTVASPLAADGLAYVHGESIMVARAPEDFARCVIDLLKDGKRRDAMAAKARDVTRSNYTWDAKWPAIADIYGLPRRTELLPAPTVHVVVPSYQHAAFIEERLESVFAQEYPHFRVTVIDDNSTDGSDDVIRDLQDRHEFEYIRREDNSGSPFTAWEYAARNTPEDLIWICESDDAAEPLFLSKLVKLLTSKQTIKVAYSASVIVDEDGRQVGTTDKYHADAFHPTRWAGSFIAHGPHELSRYVRFGMVVPNMSSALFDKAVFARAFTPEIKSYRLAGDWLFLGQAMQYGDIAFTPEHLNRFRRHRQSSRERTTEARMIAEHASVRLRLSALVNASDYEMMDAAKHDLHAILASPDLAGAVGAELASFDRASAGRFDKLVAAHCKNGKASEELATALELRSPLPVQGGNAMFPGRS